MYRDHNSKRLTVTKDFMREIWYGCNLSRWAIRTTSVIMLFCWLGVVIWCVSSVSGRSVLNRSGSGAAACVNGVFQSPSELLCGSWPLVGVSGSSARYRSISWSNAGSWVLDGVGLADSDIAVCRWKCKEMKRKRNQRVNSFSELILLEQTEKKFQIDSGHVRPQKVGPTNHH